MGCFSHLASILLLIMPLMCFTAHSEFEILYLSSYSGIFFILVSLFVWLLFFGSLFKWKAFKQVFLENERPLLVFGRCEMMAGTALQQFGFWKLTDGDHQTGALIIWSSHAALILFAATFLISHFFKFQSPLEDWNRSQNIIYFVYFLALAVTSCIRTPTVNATFTAALLFIFSLTGKISRRSKCLAGLCLILVPTAYMYLTKFDLELGIWCMHLAYNSIIGLFLIDIYCLYYGDSVDRVGAYPEMKEEEEDEDVRFGVGGRRRSSDCQPKTAKYRRKKFAKSRRKSKVL